jgi:hypothetical protein
MIGVGQKVYEAGDPKHVGIIEIVNVSKVWVRWHKGYASWVPRTRLIKV